MAEKDEGNFNPGLTVRKSNGGMMDGPAGGL